VPAIATSADSDIRSACTARLLSTLALAQAWLVAGHRPTTVLSRPGYQQAVRPVKLSPADLSWLRATRMRKEQVPEVLMVHKYKVLWILTFLLSKDLTPPILSKELLEDDLREALKKLTFLLSKTSTEA
jgi:hypothetical protein